MTTISLHYWAGARAAAGVASEEVEAESVAAALALVIESRGEHFARVLRACSVLVDGVVRQGADLDQLESAPVRAELLPPFAGGASLRLE